MIAAHVNMPPSQLHGKRALFDFSEATSILVLPVVLFASDCRVRDSRCSHSLDTPVFRFRTSHIQQRFLLHEVLS